MGLTSSVAIAAAEGVERAGGPRAGLAVWRKLATTTTEPDVRRKATLAALRCAASMRDFAVFSDLTRWWETAGDGGEEEVFALCGALSRDDLLGAASELMAAEARRQKSARALYAWGRCLEGSRDGRAAGVFREAAAIADREKASALARSSLIRLAAIAVRDPRTREEALRDASRLHAETTDPAEQLLLAETLLASPSRFVRATAIGILDDLVTKGGPLRPERDCAFSLRALFAAAAYADGALDQLTEMEVDRLLGLFGREAARPHGVHAARALDASWRLARARTDDAVASASKEAVRFDPALGPLHERARKIAAGDVESWDAPKSLSNTLLEAAAGVLGGGFSRAERALAVLAEAQETGVERVPARAWSVVTRAMTSGDASVTTAALRLATAMLNATNGAPAKGWRHLASCSAACGAHELAIRALYRGVAARESGAAEALGLTLTTEAWRAAKSGDRSRAIACLREAAALAEKPDATSPTRGASTPQA